ncbi:hypothetical protein [Sphaerochaeta sp. S2]|uniref:hypothetical protein n=1 Tax=Sphaerochaeta sp. S2 TaxID=2798868 RepID=UPI0018E90C59|nr:hypothetical protein [Sphaerochaeta sp. S2]MBJ2354823.1 hypothetical protein [Sphaerochaeta sp. S2]
MHELINRYIAETVRHLKPAERMEVEKELTANILDMLPEDPSDEAVEQTLLSMGSPSSLAAKYRGREQYLIGPATYDTYIMVLKIVALVVSLVTLVFTVLSFFFSPSGLSIFEMIAKALASIFSAASGAFLWVTITFAILERCQVKTDLKDWNLTELHNLEEVPTREIKKRDSIADLVGLSLFFLFLGFMYMKGDLLAIYTQDREPIPLFVADLLRPYLIGWMLTTAIAFFVAMFKMARARWTKTVLGFSAASDLLGVFYFIFVATRWNIYNNTALLYFNLSLEWWQIIIKAACVVLLLLTLVSIGEDTYTTLRRNEPAGSGKAPAL